MQEALKRWLISSTFVVVICAAFSANAVDFDSAKVGLGGKELAVEFAHRFEQRAQGLMHRESLCEDCGMLFKYERPRLASMWMKNTLIPLDVAFIDQQGVIVDIKSMKPHDLTSIGSSKEVLFALEMNKGWFNRHSIKEGDKIAITLTY